MEIALLKDKVIVLQGAGSVGRFLGEYLHEEGAKILFTDINQKNIELFKEIAPSAEFIDSNEIYDLDCDIYAPCALGATVNDETVEKLNVRLFVVPQIINSKKKDMGIF